MYDMEISEWTYNIFGHAESADDRLLKLMRALSEKQEEIRGRKLLFKKKYRKMRGSSKKGLK